MFCVYGFLLLVQIRAPHCTILVRSKGADCGAGMQALPVSKCVR